MSVFSKIKRNGLWLLFSLLPKQKNKAVLQSYYGRGLSDSPGAIAAELLKRGGWKLYWTVKGQQEAKSLPAGITPVRVDSVRSIYHLCTAGVWVDNSRKWAYTQKRSSQFYVQTWHGFPLKRIEKDAGDALPPDYIRAAKKDSRMCDLFLSDSHFLTELYHSAFWYEGEVLQQGFPRNDILFRENTEILEKVKKALSLPEGKKLLLYAPTFRKDMSLSVYDVDYARLCRALAGRFGGDWLVLAKLHPNVADRAEELKLDSSYVINASAYPDIQELYLASDVLLSDYSSVMFDYLCTGKPCFLYVSDLSAYRDDRNFTLDLKKLPYAAAEDNDALECAVLDFSTEEQSRRIQAFEKEFGICETGKATQAVCDLLERKKGSRA